MSLKRSRCSHKQNPQGSTVAPLSKPVPSLPRKQPSSPKCPSPLSLTESGIDDLVAFLASLTSPAYRELSAQKLERQRALAQTSRPPARHQTCLRPQTVLDRNRPSCSPTEWGEVLPAASEALVIGYSVVVRWGT